MGTTPPPNKTRTIGRQVIQAHTGMLDATWRALQSEFSVKIPLSFWREGENDPLMRQVMPDPQELAEDALAVADPVGDERHSPVPWVVHKYENRALLLLTRNCDIHCRYCFRRSLPSTGSQPSDSELSNAIAYLRGAGLEEVIFSGGDPLTVPAERILSSIDALRDVVPAIRIHSRSVTAMPSRVTATLVAGLRERAPITIVLHVNHADEFTPEADAAIGKLQRAGVSLHNQAVLLKGVNDSVEVLKDLASALLVRGVSFYYLHQLDPVAGAGHFRVSNERGCELMKALRPLVSGVVFPRFVFDDGQKSAKRDVQN
jgi:lysine 2,3-aminomutase